jgi:AraC-like DNA-binding protein
LTLWRNETYIFRICRKWRDMQLAAQPTEFSTRTFPRSKQLDGWRHWYDGVFDVVLPAHRAGDSAFKASNRTRNIGGVGLSRVSAPPLRALRPRELIRRNPIDHWCLTVGSKPTTLTLGADAIQVPANTPFLMSLGEPFSSERGEDTRIQLYLPRDTFSHIAPALDAARGRDVSREAALLLSDYLRLLDRTLAAIPAEMLNGLAGAITSMILACLSPSAQNMGAASVQIEASRMERVRQIVRRALLSPALGPEMLCREAFMSRSQLYRLLQAEGGVAAYIQRHRLQYAYKRVADPGCVSSFASIAEALCFSDASAFSRAFRREFGVSPRDVRAAGQAGLVLPRRPDAPSGADRFADWLRTL